MLNEISKMNFTVATPMVNEEKYKETITNNSTKMPTLKQQVCQQLIIIIFIHNMYILFCFTIFPFRKIPTNCVRRKAITRHTP